MCWLYGRLASPNGVTHGVFNYFRKHASLFQAGGRQALALAIRRRPSSLLLAACEPLANKQAKESTRVLGARGQGKPPNSTRYQWEAAPEAQRRRGRVR